MFELHRIFKRPSTYILMLAMPLLFTFLFGGMLGGTTDQAARLAVVDQDQTAFSKQLIQQLQQEKQIEIQKVAAKKAAGQLDDKQVQGVVTIPHGFTEQLIHEQAPKIDYQHPPGATSAPILQQMINQSVQTIKTQVAAATAWSDYSDRDWHVIYKKMADAAANERQPTAKVVSMAGLEQEPILTGASHSASGFSIMFVMMMLLSVTGILIEGRKTGVWQRMLTTPSSKLQIMLGYLLSFFLIGWIQFGLLMISSNLLFNVYWGNGLAGFVLISALLLAIVGLGLAIASIAKTTEQQSAIGTLVIVSTCMLGGVYWPISIVPIFMQKLAQFVPQFWAIKGFTSLIAEQGGIADIMLPTFILLGFAAVFLIFGLSRVRYEA